MDGKAYLEKVISDRLRAARELPEPGLGAASLLPEIQGMATGLIAAGVLRPEDAERLLTDLRKTMERAGWIGVIRQFSARTSHFGPVVRRRSDAPPVSQPVVPASPPDSHDLLRVIPLVGRNIKH